MEAIVDSRELLDHPSLVFTGQGKVRDIYALRQKRNTSLLFATDRVSAFDSVLPTPIPGRGAILTRISKRWFSFFSDVWNHLIDIDSLDLEPDLRRMLGRYIDRAMLVENMLVIPIECVVRGYLTGTGWKEYRERQTVCGITLPSGLLGFSKLPEAIFTPSTKAPQGKHDENVSIEQMIRICERFIVTHGLRNKTMALESGRMLATFLRNRSLDIYRRGHNLALSRGIIIADTKIEFGISEDGAVCLIDELLTPDSSRFWPADLYQAGRVMSMDKQIIRNFLKLDLGWDGTPPAPELPERIVDRTVRVYEEIEQKLFG